MIHTKVDPYWFDRFQIVRTRNTEFNGKTVGEIARMERKEPLDLLLDLIVEDPETIWVQIVDPRMLPPAIEEFIKHPMGMPSSDVTALPVEPGKSGPHQRLAQARCPRGLSGGVPTGPEVPPAVGFGSRLG